MKFMKDQYFGDIGDYKKFSILRTLSQIGGMKILICWMQTEDDGRTDGRFTQYLSSPTEWRKYDSLVFDLLAKSILGENKRTLKIIENAGLIPDAKFFSFILDDNLSQRDIYFSSLLDQAQDVDLVFLDPDNGMEVKSVILGKRNSSKYLYWQELENLYKQDKSLLIYQHFGRVDRSNFIQVLAHKILDRTSAQEVSSLQTNHNVYLAIPQTRHKKDLDESLLEISKRWGSQIKIQIHTKKNTKEVSSTSQLSIFDI
jgi:hypothetical protein